MKKINLHRFFFITIGIILLGILSGCVKTNCIDPSLVLSHDVKLDSNAKPTLLYVMPADYYLGDKGRYYLGDTEVMMRLVSTAKKMGWNTFLYNDAEKIIIKNTENFFGIYVPSAYYPNKKKIFIPNVPLFTIDWIIPRGMIKKPGKCTIFLEEASDNPGVEGVLGVSYDNIDGYVKEKRKNSNLKFLMNWYPTVAATKYKPNPKSLMYCGDKYLGNMRTESKKYKKLWKLLDKTGNFFVYGSKHSWEELVSYRGYLPADGKSFVDAVNRHGIYLVLHGEKHLKEGVPSGRIFEGAAASAVIISDRHPFVKREFKDSVLYIDESRGDLFEQIQAHMRWIKENPEEAKAKAVRAHSIFLENFTFEEQLSRFYKYFKITRNDGRNELKKERVL